MSTVIIFGLSSAGLFLLREMSRAGISVIGIGRRNDFGRFSKYGVNYIANTERELREVIEKIISQCEEKPQGIITSAFYLTMIINKIPEVFDLIDIDGPGIEMLRVFDDKISSFEFLKKFGIPFPRTYKISEAESIDEGEFPLIIKWRSTELEPSKRIIEKTKIIVSKLELLCITGEINTSDSKLILQPYIDGKHIEEYGYGGYFENGEEKAGIVVNGLRQFPMGIYTFAREVEDNKITHEIKSKLFNMLKSINYTGFIHFDIKVDGTKEEFYVLDVNPRPWNSVGILGKKFPNFIDVSLNRGKQLTKRIDIIQWVDLFSDAISIIKRCIMSRSIISAFKDYGEYFKYSTTFNMFKYYDIKPVIASMWIGIKKLCKSIIY